LRSLDVSCLARFVTTCEHDNEDAPAAREVQPIARSEIDSHLRYVAAHRFSVAEISGFGHSQAGGDADLCT
jgi:hypothetical protein